MNPLANLTIRDLVALALASGVKLGGGNWTKAFVWGIGSRFAMNFVNFPPDQMCPPQTQPVVQGLASIFQALVGKAPVGVGTVSQPAGSGQVIDVSFEQHSPVTQQPTG
jgi:hypothetical protein